MYVRNSMGWTRALVFYVTDIVCLFIAYMAAYFIRFVSLNMLDDRANYAGIFLIFCVIMVLSTVVLGLMGNLLKRDYLQELFARALLAFCTLSGTTLVLFAFKISEAYSRLFLMYVTVLFFILDYLLSGILMKRLYKAYIKNQALTGKNLPSAFLITDLENVEVVLKKIQDAEFKLLQIKGVKFTDGSYPETKFNDLHVCNTFDEAAYFICRGWIDEVLIYLPNVNNVPDSFLAKCREMGITIHYIVDLKTVDGGKQFVEEFASYSSLTTVFNYISPRQAVVKRAMDIVGGLIGSVFAVLIGIVIGPIIYINSPGPLLFRQLRIGKNGKYFYLLKFRSMVLDAESKKKELMEQNRVSDGMMFKLEFDPRVIGNKVLPDGTRKTGIGEFIRKTSLDEFPQFFNVLKGEMSLVGTRPPTVDEWEKYDFHHRARLAIKPGITGLWQVSGRSEITDFEEVVKLDTDYITNYRIASDIKILLKTIPALLKKKGAM